MSVRALCVGFLPVLPVGAGSLVELGASRAGVVASLGAGWPGGGPNAGPSLRCGCPALLADRGKSANSPRVRGSDSADLARKARRPRPAALLGCATRATAQPPRAGSGTVADGTSERDGGPVHSNHAMDLGDAIAKVFLFLPHATPVVPEAVGGRRAQRLCGAEERSGPRVAPRSGVERSCLSTERSEGEFCARPRAASTAGKSAAGRPPQRSGARRPPAASGRADRYKRPPAIHPSDRHLNADRVQTSARTHVARTPHQPTSRPLP